VEQNVFCSAYNVVTYKCHSLVTCMQDLGYCLRVVTVMYGMHIHFSIPGTLCDDCRKTLHDVIILISYEMHTDETYLFSYSRQKHYSPHEH